MADLGTIELRDPYPPVRADLLPVSHYRVVRGKYLGAIGLHDASFPPDTYLSTLSTYIVRQIRIIYRQLWPAYGQRFPQ